MKQNRLTVLIGILIGVLSLAQPAWAADLMDHWTWRNPLPTGETLGSVSFGKGTYVAVGSAGTILSSPNGTNWTRRDAGMSNALWGVTFGGGQFVAIGSFSLLTSTNGANWTAQSANTNDGYWSVAYGGGRFVAVNVLGPVLSSTTGTSWTTSAVGASGLYAVTYGNGVFVAVGAQGAVRTSADGRIWTARASGTTELLRGVTYGNATFVAVGTSGTILTSVNGATWQPRSSGILAALQTCTYANGRFVAAGYQAVLTSTDSVSWSKAPELPGQVFSSVVGISGQFVAVGPAGTIATSTDGMAWIGQTAGPRDNLLGVSYGNGLFVAVGGNSSQSTLLTSPDGQSWTERNAGVTGSLFRVTYDRGQFTAVGSQGILTTSRDGLAWTPGVSGTDVGLVSITAGNGLLLAAGSESEGANYRRVVVGSSNGTDWATLWTSTVGVDDGWLEELAFGDGRFVLGGAAGLYASTNGIDWAPEYPAVPAIYCLGYGHGVFIAGGGNGLLLTSSNGLAWTRLPDLGLNATSPDQLWGLNINGDLFSLAGENYPVSPILTSVDGIHWVRHSLGTQAAIRGIAFNAGRYVAVGLGGAILTCDVHPRLGPISVSPSGVAGSSVLGVSGLRYTVEASTNLADWIAVTNVPAPNGTAAFIDSAAAGKGQRFYRATPQISP